MKRKALFFFAISLMVLAISLYFDFELLDWYNNFYQAIIKKDLEIFGKQIIYFLIIGISISICQSGFSFTSEYLDLELKIIFTKISLNNHFIFPTQRNANQKFIDDASLAAEKLSSLLPMCIFYSIKAIATFVAIIIWCPSKVVLIFSEYSFPYPMAFASIIFLLVQIYVSKSYYPLIRRVDRIKRNAENTFRLKILADNRMDLKSPLIRYLYIVSLIRRFTAARSFLLSTTLGLLNSLSYVIPFYVLFSIFYYDELSFGMLMKISATFGLFQASVSYLAFNFRELSKGVAAYKRILDVS